MLRIHEFGKRKPAVYTIDGNRIYIQTSTSGNLNKKLIDFFKRIKSTLGIIHLACLFY
ncbi:hypothetical protein QBO96_16755 [Lysinibacillus capsici]|uniref:Uncharacterized protein n=1 Tax=Lysinibacillus capsici TaxID=2115968 RepID=A0ABY8KCU1_9BACI|nr:hypothetical protein [Lysinibacillus capsici]WGF37344.1 hypothetical protein QBO96_16755 [Lysinibacillus capsici]WNN76536.1 hypothetical protein RKS58_01560 [Lysinibacillus capsici]